MYTSGKLKTRQQEEAKAFLELIGVHEVGEADQVKAILEQRYKAGESFEPDLNDLERFVALWEKDVTQADIFSNYCIFKRTDSKWGQPNSVYLDFPFQETGLSAYYTALGKNTNKAGLSDEYQQCTVSIENLAKFAEAVGVQTRLQFLKTSCRSNPAAKDLVYLSGGGWSEEYGTDVDYTIPGIAEILPSKNECVSRLIWNTLCNYKKSDWLQARFRNNSHYNCREGLSQIGCILRDTAWIPQTDVGFVRPIEACRELLPKGFPFDEGYPWLSKIKFGEMKRTQAKESARDIEKAKEIGFTDLASLERALEFNKLPEDEQRRILSEHESKASDEFPEKEPKDPDRRAEKISQQATAAPERLAVERTRSVSVNRDKVKQEAEQYLRTQYTHRDGAMFCQICQKQLPFKLNDGLFYFEMVEFLLELRQHHFQNYLALCPNHSAMFKHANGSRSIMMKLFSEIKGLLLDVILADTSASILFTKTHIIDLQAVISSEAKSA